jgi:hypothetical protein
MSLDRIIAVAEGWHQPGGIIGLAPAGVNPSGKDCF